MLLDAVTLNLAKQNLKRDMKNYATIEQGQKADTALQENDIISGHSDGSICIRNNDVFITGLKSAAYQDVSAFEQAGAVQLGIEDSKNYTEKCINTYKQEVNHMFDDAVRAINENRQNAEVALDVAERAQTAADKANETLSNLNLENGLSDQTVNFDTYEETVNIATGESLNILFGKIQNWFSNILSDDITEEQVKDIFKTTDSTDETENTDNTDINTEESTE